jgi:hypothetical protein
LLCNKTVDGFAWAKCPTQQNDSQVYWLQGRRSLLVLEQVQVGKSVVVFVIWKWQ